MTIWLFILRTIFYQYNLGLIRLIIFSCTLVMPMNNCHMVLIRVFVFQNIATNSTAQRRSFIVHCLYMPSAIAFTLELFSTQKTFPTRFLIIGIQLDNDIWDVTFIPIPTGVAHSNISLILSILSIVFVALCLLEDVLIILRGDGVGCRVGGGWCVQMQRLLVCLRKWLPGLWLDRNIFLNVIINCQGGTGSELAPSLWGPQLQPGRSWVPPGPHLPRRGTWSWVQLGCQCTSRPSGTARGVGVGCGVRCCGRMDCRHSESLCVPEFVHHHKQGLHQRNPCHRAALEMLS